MVSLLAFCWTGEKLSKTVYCFLMIFMACIAILMGHGFDSSLFIGVDQYPARYLPSADIAYDLPRK